MYSRQKKQIQAENEKRREQENEARRGEANKTGAAKSAAKRARNMRETGGKIRPGAVAGWWCLGVWAEGDALYDTRIGH